VLPIQVDPNDSHFLEWFCQSAKPEPLWLDRATLVNDGGVVLGQCLKGWVSRDGCVFNPRSRTIEIPGVDHDALVQVATSLCRQLSISCLLFEDYSPRTWEFYLVRLTKADA
jgi:hypothetical protein